MCNKSCFEEKKTNNHAIENQFVDYQDHLFQFYDSDRVVLMPETEFSEPLPVEKRQMASSLDQKEYEKSRSGLDHLETQRLVEAEVFKYAFNLQVLLVESNTTTNMIDRQSADAFIEKDFLRK